MEWYPATACAKCCCVLLASAESLAWPDLENDALCRPFNDCSKILNATISAYSQNSRPNFRRKGRKSFLKGCPIFKKKKNGDDLARVWHGQLLRPTISKEKLHWLRRSWQQLSSGSVTHQIFPICCCWKDSRVLYFYKAKRLWHHCQSNLSKR